MLTLVRRLGRLLPLGVTVVAGGCYDDHHHHCDPHYDHCDDYYYDNAPPPGALPVCTSGVASGTIDTGQNLQLDPGYVAVSAEYFGQGAWRFAMRCDTAQPTSGVPCNYDMTVSPVDGSIDAFAPEDLESNDSLTRAPGTAGSNGVNLNAVTDVDLDGFTLTATPGSTLEVNLTLDGQCASPFLFWLEDGQVVSDDHSLVDLTPSAP